MAIRSTNRAGCSVWRKAMSHDIEYFMWGYQRHFRGREELHSQRLFKCLDERFAPEVFLVGVSQEGNSNRHRACVEPERDYWIHSDAFNDTLKRAKQLVTTYPESNMRFNHQVA